MWLRSEKRSSRSSQQKTSMNLRKVIKTITPTKKLRETIGTGRKNGQSKSTTTLSNCQKTYARQSPTKCNRIRAQVKRLGNKTNRKATKMSTTAAAVSVAAQINRRTRRKGRNFSESGKENCWQDGNTEDITLYAVDSRTCGKAKTSTNTTFIPSTSENSVESADGLTNDDALNSFGPIVLNTKSNEKIEWNENVKCISECDSTTDYDKQQLPSTSSSFLMTSSTPNTTETIDPEIDSTTDLIPAESTCTGDSPNTIYDGKLDTDLKSNEKDLPKVTILPSLSTNPFPTPDLTPNTRQFTPVGSGGCPQMATGSSTSMLNFSTTPDLISLFDEEMNKSTTDMVQYSDFFPYNNVITQALLSCNEVNNLCESNELGTNIIPSDISFLSSMNQTAIDNLKAFTNFQSHTSNFLSNITLSKNSYNNETMCIPSNTTVAMGGNDDNNLIHSVASTNCNIYSQQTMVCQDGMGQSMQISHAHQQLNGQNDNGDEIQLETDECMEIEEINENQEEMAWDAFDPYVFIKHLPPLTAEMRAKCPALPLKTRSSPEFNLVLDLDETLVHCSLQELSDASFKFPVLFQVSALGCLIWILNSSNKLFKRIR